MQAMFNAIAEAITTDDYSKDKRFNTLQVVYKQADQATKDALDNAFIALSGYSLATWLSDHTLTEQ